jgi:hypothetical protein
MEATLKLNIGMMSYGLLPQFVVENDLVRGLNLRGGSAVIIFLNCLNLYRYVISVSLEPDKAQNPIKTNFLPN